MLCYVHFLCVFGCGMWIDVRGGFFFIFDIDVYAGRHQNSKTRRGGGGRREEVLFFCPFLLSFSIVLQSCYYIHTSG